MKKISYIIILLVCLFSFGIFAEAQTCEYSYILSYSGFGNHSGIFTTHGNSNEYLYLRAIASKNSYNYEGTSFNDFYEKAKDLDKQVFTKLLNSYSGDDNIGDFKITYNTGTNKFDVETSLYDWYDDLLLGSNIKYDKKVFSTKNNGGTPGEMNQTYSTCPTVMSIYFDDIWRFDRAFYLEDYNYDYLSLIQSANFNSYGQFNVIGFLKNTGDNVKVNSSGKMQNNTQLLKAISCSVSFDRYGTSAADDSLDEVKSIIDAATANEEFNIRTIYEKVANLKLDSDTLKKIKNGESLSTFEQRAMKNYIYTLPYFLVENAEEATKMIQTDKKKLEDYQNKYSDFEMCIAEAYPGSDEEHLQKAISKYMEYDPNYQGLYINAMLNLLNIFGDNVDAWYEAKHETTYIDELRNDSRCANVGDSSQVNKCVAGLIDTEIKNINCTDLINKTDLNYPEQILKKSLNKICSGENYNCYQTNCNKTKNSNELSKEITDFVSGNTTAQNIVNSSIDDFYEDLIEHMGIPVETDLCKLFNEGGVIDEYVKLGLNIIRIGGPILVIILTMLDGIKMIASSREDENKKFYSNLKIRMICIVLLFLVPTVIYWLLDMLEISSCSKY